VVTSLYTAYGGLPASIVTDKYQGIGVLLVTVITGIAALTSVHVPAESWEQYAVWSDEGFMSLILLNLAVIPASLVNAGLWQRVWSGRRAFDVQIGLFVGGILIFPGMVLFGAAGILAIAAFPEIVMEDPSVAFFVLLNHLSQFWVVVVAIFAVMCTCSSVDTIQNGICGLVGADLVENKLNLNWARLFGVLVCIPAAVVACFGISVYHLFLIGDLATAVVVAPICLGMWSLTTSFGCLAGIMCSFLSVLTVGWIYTGTFVGGFEWFVLPLGFNDTSALVTFIVVPSTALISTVFISYLQTKLMPQSLVPPESLKVVDCGSVVPELFIVDCDSVDGIVKS